MSKSDTPRLIRFGFWLAALALIGAGTYQIHPALAFISIGVLILIQLYVGELHAFYHSAIPVSKPKH